jgi:antitoxin (DNA-binding transcriptional repressor) of toxin-antitoxin stability system
MTLKRIADEVSLDRKLETITAMDFRKSPGEVLASVALGKTYVITKAGKPVAVLSRLPGQVLNVNVGSKGKVSYSL